MNVWTGIAVFTVGVVVGQILIVGWGAWMTHLERFDGELSEPEGTITLRPTVRIIPIAPGDDSRKGSQASTNAPGTTREGWTTSGKGFKS